MQKIRVIFLGNSLFLEDKIGLLVGERLRENLESLGLEVVITERIGINLLDLIIGVNLLIIVDSVYVDNDELWGEVLILSLNSYYGNSIKAPHTLSLRDLLDIAKIYNLGPPKEIIIIGIGIRDLVTLSSDLSEKLKKKLDYITNKVFDLIVHFSQNMLANSRH
jgi:hydrogenase maturation protease